MLPRPSQLTGNRNKPDGEALFVGEEKEGSEHDEVDYSMGPQQCDEWLARVARGLAVLDCPIVTSKRGPITQMKMTPNKV